MVIKWLNRNEWKILIIQYLKCFLLYWQFSLVVDRGCQAELKGSTLQWISGGGRGKYKDKEKVLEGVLERDCLRTSERGRGVNVLKKNSNCRIHWGVQQTVLCWTGLKYMYCFISPLDHYNALWLRATIWVTLLWKLISSSNLCTTYIGIVRSAFGHRAHWHLSCRTKVS